MDSKMPYDGILAKYDISSKSTLTREYTYYEKMCAHSHYNQE